MLIKLQGSPGETVSGKPVLDIPTSALDLSPQEAELLAASGQSNFKLYPNDDGTYICKLKFRTKFSGSKTELGSTYVGQKHTENPLSAVYGAGANFGTGSQTYFLTKNTDTSGVKNKESKKGTNSQSSTSGTFVTTFSEFSDIDSNKNKNNNHDNKLNNNNIVIMLKEEQQKQQKSWKQNSDQFSVEKICTATVRRTVSKQSTSKSSLLDGPPRPTRQHKHKHGNNSASNSLSPRYNKQKSQSMRHSISVDTPRLSRTKDAQRRYNSVSQNSPFILSNPTSQSQGASSNSNYNNYSNSMYSNNGNSKNSRAFGMGTSNSMYSNNSNSRNGRTLGGVTGNNSNSGEGGYSNQNNSGYQYSPRGSQRDSSVRQSAMDYYEVQELWNQPTVVLKPWY